jgi:hypothetical protein
MRRRETEEISTHIMVDTITASILLTVLGMLLGVVNALFVFFTDWCMNEKNIFEKYYIWLLKLQPRYPMLTKPLGLCPVCMGFWVGVGVFAALAAWIGLPLWVFLPFISVSSYTLIKIFKAG